MLTSVVLSRHPSRLPFVQEGSFPCRRRRASAQASSVQVWPLDICLQSLTQPTTRPALHLTRKRLFIFLFLALPPSIHPSIRSSTPRVSSCHASPRHGILSDRPRPHLTPPPCRSPSATLTRSTTYLSHAANACLPRDL